ncbi:phage portal protein [Amycolatopsis pigmentata]|uniref:Phage portal protein n=1 Tax=Amycolatopsis pigmentata TaxID=450801 RepID=A0ABW5G421_9PSEU
MARRLGIRRPRVAGTRTPAGLIKATSAPTTLPGGATIPAGSQVTDATSMLGALKARTTSSINGATPLPRDDQYWALMGPGAPLYPAPLNQPNPATGQADPRRWEYPVSWNIIQDAGRLVDWSTLRNAAREVDLISQCIRVRRTEQSSLDWDITLTRRTIEANGITSKQDKNALLKQYSAEISRLIEFWSEPDTTNGYTWPEWVEMLMQESMVTDAVSIFPRFTYGGDLVSLELIDGSTVKVLLDERGNRPHPPAAAYQQWLWGFPRGEYTDAGAGQADWEGTAGSLIYKPRYTRVESPYGYSPVEQALVSANLWLRRQQWMVAEYTDGTAPRTFLKSNITALTPEQIRAWEDSLNDFYGGSTGNRHRLRLFPDGFDPVQVADAAERYKPDYDEFLVKLICAHMDVQPQEVGFTPRNGLGGAGHGESQEAITYRKALRPTAQWLVGIMNQISYAYLGMPRDLTFQFLGLDDEDQDLADQTTDRQFRAGRITLNETRDKSGLARYNFPEADMPMVVGQRGVVFLEGASTLVEPGEEVTPVQAPPLTAPPEGNDAYPPGEEPPVVRAREQKQQPAKQEPSDAAKAELAAYRNWARKNRSRPFEFTTVSKADAEAAGVDLARVVFKAGDAGPKLPSGRTWPGWTKDLAVARHWAPEISRALTGAVDARRLAEQWLKLRKAVDPAATADALQWLQTLTLPIGTSLATVMAGLYSDGYVVGQQAADALIRDMAPDWGSWKPGDTAAARAMVGNEMNLRRLLDQQDITIKSIADHRLDELAKALSEALARGDSVDTLAKALAGVLDDPEWAYMVAVTETTRAVSYATLESYLANGIEAAYWLSAEDPRVCQECQDNEDAGAVPINQAFPTGVYQPPQHPQCRCALAPAL